MVAIATGIFVALFAFGWDFVGWGTAVNEEVRLGLFFAFVLGIV